MIGGSQGLAGACKTKTALKSLAKNPQTTTDAILDKIVQDLQQLNLEEIEKLNREEAEDNAEI